MIRLACATLSCDGFGDEDFKNSFLKMPEIGFKYAEFNCWHPSTLTPQKMLDLTLRCKKARLTPVSIHGSSFGGNSSDNLTKDVTHKLRMMEAARELGCNMISATGSRRGSQGGLDAIIKVLQEIMPAAEQWGIQVSLENHVGNNLESIDDYQKIFARIDSPNLGICFDTGHFDASGIHLDDVIDTFGLRINHIHLKENNGFGKKEFTLFGKGTTKNHHIIKRMIDLGYSGNLVVELSPEIGEGSAVKFKIDDLIKPFEMFRKYETIER